MLQNSRVTAFTVFELLRENQLGGGGVILPPRLGLNVDPSNLVFLKTYNIEFDDITITFMDQNSRSLEREEQISLPLLIKRNYLLFHRAKNKKICHRIWIFVICNKSNKYGKIWLNINKSKQCCF